MNTWSTTRRILLHRHQIQIQSLGVAFHGALATRQRTARGRSCAMCVLSACRLFVWRARCDCRIETLEVVENGWYFDPSIIGSWNHGQEIPRNSFQHSSSRGSTRDPINVKRFGRFNSCLWPSVCCPRGWSVWLATFLLNYNAKRGRRNAFFGTPAMLTAVMGGGTPNHA